MQHSIYLQYVSHSYRCVHPVKSCNLFHFISCASRDNRFEVLWKWWINEKTCAYRHIEMIEMESEHLLGFSLNLLWSRCFWTSCLDGVFHSTPNWINRGNYLCPLAAINYKRRNVHSGTFTPIIIQDWIISITFLWKVLPFFSLFIVRLVFDNISSSKWIRYSLYTYT